MSSAESNSTNTGPTPKRGSALAVAVTLGLLALLVWALNPRQPRFRPAPPDPVSDVCARSKADFIPTSLTEIPSLPLTGLPAAAKNRLLLRLNMEPCTCGCQQSLAACRASNPSCRVSSGEAETAVKDEQANPVAARTNAPAQKR
jgi:hypothetical protein